MPSLTRRNLLRSSALGASALLVGCRALAEPASSTAPAPAPANSGPADRAHWAATADRIARPVLAALAQRQLKKTMPVETVPGGDRARAEVTHLEAFGRTLTGLAPWLELPASADSETKVRQQLADLAREALDAATDPASPDFLNFSRGGQPLVDAAFLCHAILRAPTALWAKLPEPVRRRVVAALEETRAIKPGNNNWLLFSATVEAMLFKTGQTWKPEPVQTALSRHMEWYKGDGVYGDGPDFHWDYYNSFVIQPMLLDVLETLGAQKPEWNALKPQVLRRAQRYAAIQERLISPEGTFPPFGRSLCYRCGAFQLLAQIALRRQLPAPIAPAQVRCALTAVIRRTIDAPGTFDEKGFLRIGFCGHQPHLAERYISTGSLYLCTAGLLPLGLPPTDEFWQAAPADWTSKKIWSGQDALADHAITG